MQAPSQSPSAWVAPSPAPVLLPSAASPSSDRDLALLRAPGSAVGPRRAPSIRPHLAPTTQGAASSGAALHSADPVSDARRTLGVLLGAGPGEGLLDRVAKDVEALLAAYESAFEADMGPSSAATDPSRALDSLDSLVALLSRSSAGGFVPSSAPTSANEPLSQVHHDRAGERAQALFHEGVRAREAAEVVRVGLSG